MINLLDRFAKGLRVCLNLLKSSYKIQARVFQNKINGADSILTNQMSYTHVPKKLNLVFAQRRHFHAGESLYQSCSLGRK